MAKSPKEKTKKPEPINPDMANLDLDPNAWGKFEKLVKTAAKMGPKPHKLKPKDRVRKPAKKSDRG